MKQRLAARVPLAAMIVREDDERIPREPVAVDCFKDAADTFVHPLDHADVVFARSFVPSLACAYVVRLIGRLDGRDHRVIGDVSKERLARVMIDE